MRQTEGGICLIEMSVANYARKHVFESKAVQHNIFIIVFLYKVYSLHGSLALPWSVPVYSALSTHSTQSTRFTRTSLKCTSVFSIVYTLYTVYTFHWHFSEVYQCIQHCLHNLHGSLELPWSVSVYLALSTNSKQSTRYSGTSLKRTSVFSIVYTLYTVHTVHCDFPEVYQWIQHCLHTLHSPHDSLGLPWSVPVNSAFSTHSTQSTRYTGTSLKFTSEFSIVYTL